LAHKREDQALFGIVQGGAYRDLREHAAKELAAMDFPGYSIGGTSIGEPKEVCLQMVADAVRYLPNDKPRYLMGVGSLDYILTGISLGVDMFDCVLANPHRAARGLNDFARPHQHQRRSIQERLHAARSRMRLLHLQHYTKAYLHHLQMTNEEFGKRLNSIHNIRFLIKIMEGAREAIQEDRFAEYRDRVLAKYGDERGF
jgi:queuine tRNA-ribosyltransferase